jgi:hypothetical protein
MDIEEEGMDENGRIPESECVRIVEMAMIGGKSARVKVVKRGKFPSYGNEDIRELIFKW